jgi:hypothetical protein
VKFTPDGAEEPVPFTNFRSDAGESWRDEEPFYLLKTAFFWAEKLFEKNH